MSNAREVSHLVRNQARESSRKCRSRELLLVLAWQRDHRGRVPWLRLPENPQSKGSAQGPSRHEHPRACTRRRLATQEPLRRNDLPDDRRRAGTQAHVESNPSKERRCPAHAPTRQWIESDQIDWGSSARHAAGECRPGATGGAKTTHGASPEARHDS